MTSTLNELINELTRLRDAGPLQKGFGDLPIFVQDGQGGSFNCGSVRIQGLKDIYAEYGPLEKENKEDIEDESVVILYCDSD